MYALGSTVFVRVHVCVFVCLFVCCCTEVYMAKPCHYSLGISWIHHRSTVLGQHQEDGEPQGLLDPHRAGA
jgi:hypothetical protein